MKREPFPEIVEQTLASLWKEVYQEHYSVRWNPPSISSSDQLWRGNFFLNTIYADDFESCGFDPIRREFSRSRVQWKRLIQSLYVRLATMWPTRRLMTQCCLSVQPPIAESRHLLIIPGNHKIRMLNHSSQTVFAMLKSGFHNRFMEQEIDSRRQAFAFGLPVPELIQMSEDKSWFQERYISGTPLNRLANVELAEQSLREVGRLHARFLIQTSETTTVGDYVSHLFDEIESEADSNRKLPNEVRDKLYTTVKLIRDSLQDFAREPIRIGRSHGDFQPANILRNDEQTWMIDWEYSRLRVVTYDACVYAFEARLCSDISERMVRFAESGIDSNNLFRNMEWPDWNLQTKSDRILIVLLFWLEEILFRLSEISQPYLQGRPKYILKITEDAVRSVNQLKMAA